MLPEVIRPWPLLVGIPTAFDSAFIEFCISDLIRMTAFLVSVNVVRGTEALSTGTTRDITVMGLIVPLSVLPSGMVSRGQKSRVSSSTYLISDFVLTFSRQVGQVSPLSSSRTFTWVG